MRKSGAQAIRESRSRLDELQAASHDVNSQPVDVLRYIDKAVLPRLDRISKAVAKPGIGYDHPAMTERFQPQPYAPGNTDWGGKNEFELAVEDALNAIMEKLDKLLGMETEEARSQGRGA